MFRYLRDPLFLAACALYALNRWVWKPHTDNPFLLFQFNDLLLIPCALPVLLWLQRSFGLRGHDRMPGAGEVFGHLALWSVLFEVIGPHLMRRATGDPLDVLAYAVGALMSWLWWGRRSEVAAGILACRRVGASQPDGNGA